MQFSLRKLLLFFVVVAIALALFGGWGIAVTLFLLLQTAWIKDANRRVKLVLGWAIIFLLGSCVVHGHREVYRISGCRYKLKTIGLALHNYHDRYGQFPPRYIADAQGRPMHSWRVLILPYLSDPATQRVYQKYRFDEPWSSPGNQGLAAQLPDCFRCPTTNAAEPDSTLATHYVVVSGSGTAWPGATGTRVRDFSDGTSHTLLLVEIAHSDIQWLEPRDATLDQMLSNDDGALDVPSSHHYRERTYFFLSTYPRVGNVLMADASCRMLTYPPSRDDLAALLTIDDGETIDEEAVFRWNRGTFSLGLDMMRCALFALLVVSFVLLEW